MFYKPLKGLRPKSIAAAPATMVLVEDSMGRRAWFETMDEFRAAMLECGRPEAVAEIYEAEFIQPLEIGFLYEAGNRRFILYDDGGVWPAGRKS